MGTWGREKFSHTLLESLAGSETCTDKDRLPGEKHTSLSSINFTGHWRLHEEMKTQRKGPECCVPAEMQRTQQWKNGIGLGYEAHVGGTLSKACSCRFFSVTLGKDEGAPFLWVLAGLSHEGLTASFREEGQGSFS